MRIEQHWQMIRILSEDTFGNTTTARRNSPPQIANWKKITNTLPGKTFSLQVNCFKLNRRGLMAPSKGEIERKWLVEDSPDLTKYKGAEIVQGYLTISPKGDEVRVRQKGEAFFETVKTGTGLERGEVEIELTKKQFKKLWPATRGRRLEKVRYTLKQNGRKIEFDIYKKGLAGLKVVEVEFKSRKQASAFKSPPWFGREVTRKDEYKNANLAARKTAIH